MITPRQKEILNYTKDYIKKNGYSPSLEEIGKHFKLSVSTVHQHIEALKDKGFLNKTENHARSIDIFSSELLIQVPFFGTIVAGQPIEAIEERETIAVPKSNLPSNGNFYALKVSGNSMIDENINNGDIILVKNQQTANNGDRVVALINNTEATLKRYYKEKNQIRLQPANKQFSPIIVNKNQKFNIQGVVFDIIKQEQPNITFEYNSTSHDYDQKINRELNLKQVLNTVQCVDCVEGMKRLPDNSIDVIVTSPPYDSVRDYNGFNYNLHDTGKEIFRILKNGGVAIMVIQDQTKNFGKSLTSFRTIIDWCDNIGFKLFETVIYKKHGAEGAWWTKRFRVDHEYIPIFLKGERPQYFQKDHLKIPSKHGGKTMTGCATRLTNGKTLQSHKVTINPLKCRGTIWDYVTCGDGTRLKHQHPATFPDKIPVDFIQCFCPPKGIVIDPFLGSGTTALAAINQDRNYIGFEISEEYCELAKKRIKEERQTLQNKLL
ncbi:MAG: transcriptional repressor LexA [Candidatus Buchananbacteria bacterium]